MAGAGSDSPGTSTMAPLGSIRAPEPADRLAKASAK